MTDPEQSDSERARSTLKYTDRINLLITDLHVERENAPDASAARNLSLAITHLEDALFRVGPPRDYQPNPGHSSS